MERLAFGSGNIFGVCELWSDTYSYQNRILLELFRNRYSFGLLHQRRGVYHIITVLSNFLYEVSLMRLHRRGCVRVSETLVNVGDFPLLIQLFLSSSPERLLEIVLCPWQVFFVPKRDGDFVVWRL
jgi:hypothetical protein